VRTAKEIEVRVRLLAGFLLVGGIILAHGIAYADVYRCVGANGEVLLADSPCPSGTQTVSVTSDSAAPPASIQKVLSQQELDQLLAPIALYPDALVAQVLMASTYPLEVIEAARWVRAHPELKGDQLEAALQEQSWDPSVKGLVVVPQVLTMMDERLDWTEKLGDAFLAQQQAVMDTIQSLRARAQTAGNLTSTPEQTVVTEGKEIRIEPAKPEVIYVPVYNPAVIYGPWWWPAPPYYWYPPGYVATGPFIYFGFGIVVGAAIWGACDWGHRTVVVNVPHYNTFNHTRVANPQWSHDVDHRRGVPYRDDATRHKFGRELPGVDARRDFRGYPLPHRQIPRPGAERIHEQPARPGVPPVPPQGHAGRELPGAAPRVPAAPGVGATEPRAAPRPVPFPPGPSASREPGAIPRAAPPPPVPTPREPRAVPGAVPLRPPPFTAGRSPPAFETFGRGDAARAYSNRGADSRSAHPSAGAGGTPRAHPRR
jgi:hypothetical protein